MARTTFSGPLKVDTAFWANPIEFANLPTAAAANEGYIYYVSDALKASETILVNVIFKHNFWLQHASKINNDRQRKVLNLLLDGFDRKLNTAKWARICKCSQDTALRDIKDLINKQVLFQMPGGGRSTSYSLVTK